MIKCEVIEEFTLGEYKKLKNIERASGKKEEGRLYEKDTFTCDKEMVDYLLGNNPIKRAVVKVIEIIPEVPIIKDVEKEETKKTTKKTSKKK